VRRCRKATGLQKEIAGLPAFNPITTGDIMKTTLSTSRKNRLHELENKISYVRSVCDAYKGKNNYLYQTNLIYLNKLKKQLMEELEES
jgi:hypothetical protein